MAGEASGDVLQQTVDSFAQRVSDYASGIASRLGSPLSGQQLTQDEAVQRWNFSPLGSTDAADAAYHQLVAQGQAPGQALNQVYPMRQLLMQGADINDSIAKAKQLAGWAADATGTKPPEQPEGSTLPLSLAQQSVARSLGAMPSGPVAPGPGVLPPPPAAPAPAALPTLPAAPAIPPQTGMPPMPPVS